MKIFEEVEQVEIPDNNVMRLVKRNDEYMIYVGREELMTSRAHESELELARLGCAHITRRRHPRVVVGGLGMGYTLSEVLRMLRPEAEIVVAEMIPAVVRWNRLYFGALNGSPLEDARVSCKLCNVAEIIQKSSGLYDAILLDVDNGPTALTHSGNNQLYTREGVRACMQALKPDGTLSIWSASVEPAFEKRLRGENLDFKLHPVPAYKGAKGRARYVWVISRSGARAGR
ncbi:MAG: hypothetical protein PHO37_08350 [Kiritimatiellae bacterium]|nr:hypothetical protein [Kiritimatiellia bacterium]